MSRLKCQLLFLSVLALSGCKTPPQPASVKRVDPMATALDQAIAKKDGQKVVGPEVPVALPRYGEKVTVSYMGDAAMLLADVAKGRGPTWSFAITGPQPRLPIYVQVNAQNASFMSFMGDVASQLGQRADIAMNGTAIELRYRGQN